MKRRMVRRGVLRRFGAAREGSAAIELGFVALPFFLIIFGLAEISMIGFGQATLDFAAAETARQIRTGQAQQANMSHAQIQQRLCDQAQRFLILTCDNLYIDVDSFTSFVDASNAENANPIQDGSVSTAGFGYTPGAGSDIIVVRAYYTWQVKTPMFQQFFANVGSDKRLLVTTLMFRNEPFSP